MTAVQTEKLQSLHRLDKTFKVMDRIRPHIQQAQGILTREELNKIPTQPDASVGHSTGFAGQAVASPMDSRQT